MRKLVTLALLCLVAACAKEPAPEAAVKVVLEVANLRSGNIGTKAGVPAILNVTAPSGSISLHLQSTAVAARQYDVTTGQEVELPAGTYTVTGSYNPSYSCEVYRGRGYNTPPYSVSQSITITEGVTNYSVDAIYDCFALVIDYTQAEKYKHLNKNASPVDVPFVDDGDYGVLYVKCTSSWTWNDSYMLYVFPVNPAEQEQATYQLVTSGTQGVKVENGKWYYFGPTPVVKYDGTLSPQMPTWVPGQ